ncbi:MAG: hypothetical protein GF317_18905 [Candidatus Lokiarchaeota archaeon]|nr:hypothetical protein [Candidatus Lokiarchaeota archaeon]MBD3201588.1 hypothetical protein [Candidatus Lokiarchaeota archaeon]
MREFNTKKLILASILLLLFIIGTVLIFVVPYSIKSTYGQSVSTSDGEIISFNVFEPKAVSGPNKKAVIIGHGFMANKEFMKGYAIELAAAGFVAIPFDFRGHGQSTGELNRGSLLNDVLAIKSYLASRGDIDMNNLGYIGYSMGGGPGNSIVNNDTAFKAFVGVGTWLQEGLRKGNSTDQLNVLMIQAKFDEAVELSNIKESVANRTGLSISNIDVNQLYGSFLNGNATQIYLDDNSNHLAVAWDTDFLREARDWMINTFPDVNTPDEDFYGTIRLFILIIQVIGGMGIVFLALDQISKLLKFTIRDPDNLVKIDTRETTPEKLALKSLFYSLIFGIPGIFIIIWLFLPLPLAIEGFVLSLLFGQSFGFLILFWRLGKKNEIKYLDYFKKSIGSKENLPKSILFGIILAIILYVIVYVSVGLNYVGMIPSISKIPWVPIYIIIGFVIFLIYHINLQMLIQSKYPFERNSTIKILVINFGLQFLYVISYILLVSFLTGSLFYFGTMIPVATPILIITTFISVFCYKKTGNIIAGTIVNSVFFVLILSTIAPYQSLLSFLLGFLG